MCSGVLERHDRPAWPSATTPLNANFSEGATLGWLTQPIDCEEPVTTRFRLIVLSLLLVVVCASVAFATDFAVIVHPSNAAKAMSLADLGKILREKTTNWPNGRVITVVIRDPNSPAMKFVIEKAMGGTAEDGKAILNEESRKPAASIIFVSSDEDIVKTVEANPTAIGIVDVYNITSGVKVIRIDDKQPFDPGYVLKGH